MARRISPRINAVIALVLALGLSVSVTLIVMGGRESNESESTPSGAGTSSEASPSTSHRSPTATLPVKGTSAESISALSGLAFPPDMTDFKSAATTDGNQIDVTFRASTESVAAFVADSGLPEPVGGQRMITHSSPLWDLNPPDGETISGTQDDRTQDDRTQDDHGGVHRSVEILSPTSDGAAMHADTEDAQAVGREDGDNNVDAANGPASTAAPASPPGTASVRISITPLG